MRIVIASVFSIILSGCASTIQEIKAEYAPVRMSFNIPFNIGWQRAVMYSRNCHNVRVTADRFDDMGVIGVSIQGAVSNAQVIAMDVLSKNGGTDVLIYARSGVVADIKTALPGWMTNGEGAPCSI